MTYIDSKYIDFLEERREKRALKIPRYLSSDILKDRQMMKAICIWLELKPLFYDGLFKRAKQRSKTLAHYLCMSHTAYKYKIKRLEEAGFVYFDRASNMYLCSWDKFFTILGHERQHNRRYKFYRLKNVYRNSEFLLRYYAIHENFEQQTKTLEQKIYKKYFSDAHDQDIGLRIRAIQNDDKIAIEDRQRLIQSLSSQFGVHTFTKKDKAKLKRLKKSGAFNQFYLEEMRNYFKALNEFNFTYPVNFDVSISCQKMADLYGLRSASSGYYWQRLMKDHFFEIKRRCVFIPGVTYSQLYWGQQSGNLNANYFQGNKRGVFKRLNNELKLLPLEQF